jgi:inward rectifier potassium channel
VNVSFRLTIARTTRTAEGVSMYRNVELPLLRDRAPSLSRAWTVVHPIGAGSPLAGAGPASLAAAEAELTLEVSGVDEVSGRPVHAQRTWLAPAIAWDARFADILSELPDGNLLVDLRRFDEVTPLRAV